MVLSFQFFIKIFVQCVFWVFCGVFVSLLCSCAPCCISFIIIPSPVPCVFLAYQLLPRSSVFSLITLACVSAPLLLIPSLVWFAF